MSQLTHQAGGVPFYPQVVSCVVLFTPSTNWIRPTHIREGTLFYSVY